MFYLFYPVKLWLLHYVPVLTYFTITNTFQLLHYVLTYITITITNSYLLYILQIASPLFTNWLYFTTTDSTYFTITVTYRQRRPDILDPFSGSASAQETVQIAPEFSLNYFLLTDY
jgi:hypothetical protein